MVSESPQIIAGIIGLVILILFREDIKALILRIAKIRFPGGAELSTSQSERQINEEKFEQKPLSAAEVPLPGLPSDLTPQQQVKLTVYSGASLAFDVNLT